MTARQLDQIVEGMAAAFALEKTRLLLEFERIRNEVSERVATLRDGEQGERGLPGERGDPGPQGERGERGETGERGQDGQQGALGASGSDGVGERGEQGDKGDAGEKGDKGEQGAPGEQGEPGPAGETGPRGEAGQPGERGERGERGEPGERGQRGMFLPPATWAGGVHDQGELVFCDGSTWCARCETAQQPPHSDWAPVALAGLDGRSGEARGLYDPQAAYSKLDRVCLDGSEWIAKLDDPGVLPGDGWMLSAKAGSKGKPGERGPKGERGDPGIGVEGVTSDGYALALALTNGKTLRLDLRTMFERYDQERGE